jgi:hypothetical protein
LGLAASLVGVTADELALLGLAAGDPLPAGGQVLDVEVRSGTGTAWVFAGRYLQAFHERFGVSRICLGTLNLWADAPVTWEDPVTIQTHEFCPIILAEHAIGVVLRSSEPGAPRDPRFLEVLSPVKLRPQLRDVNDGQRISVRLLSGSLLKRG